MLFYTNHRKSLTISCMLHHPQMIYWVTNSPREVQTELLNTTTYLHTKHSPLKNVSLPPAFPAEAPATALPDADSSPPSLGLGGTPLTLPLGMAVPGLPFTSAPGPVAGGDTSGRGEGAWLLIRGMGLSHLICVCKGGVGALLGGEGAGEWGEGGLLSPTTPSPPPSSPALLILTHTSVLDNSVLFFMVSSASTWSPTLPAYPRRRGCWALLPQFRFHSPAFFSQLTLAHSILPLGLLIKTLTCISGTWSS